MTWGEYLEIMERPDLTTDQKRKLIKGVKFIIEATRGVQTDFHTRNAGDVQRCINDLHKQGFKTRILSK